jgi:hypothetical protein
LAAPDQLRWHHDAGRDVPLQQKVSEAVETYCDKN